MQSREKFLNDLCIDRVFEGPSTPSKRAIRGHKTKDLCGGPITELVAVALKDVIEQLELGADSCRDRRGKCGDLIPVSKQTGESSASIFNPRHIDIPCAVGTSETLRIDTELNHVRPIEHLG